MMPKRVYFAIHFTTWILLPHIDNDFFYQENDYLQGRCSVLESQIEQHISNEESYESQINNLMNNINTLENQLQTANDENVSEANMFHHRYLIGMDKFSNRYQRGH